MVGRRTTQQTRTKNTHTTNAFGVSVEDTKDSSGILGRQSERASERKKDEQTEGDREKGHR